MSAVVPVVLSILFLATGRVVAGAVLFLAAGFLAQALALSPAFRERFERMFAAVARSVEQFLRVLLLGAVWLVLFVPASAVVLVRHREFGRPPGATAGWLAHARIAVQPTPRRPFDRRPRVSAGRLVPALTIVAALIALDLTTGAVLQGTGILRVPEEERLDTVRESRGAEAASLAMQAYPWAADYYADLVDYTLTAPVLEPFLVSGQRPFHSPYINVDERERESYQQHIDPSAQPLRVAFFGGSTMFGYGQRDEHTIPSEFARIAEAYGVPVEVHNFGVLGWVSWQEYLYFEQLLAAGEKFDAVVFFDGYNDANVQNGNYSRDPTYLGAAQYQQIIRESFHETQTYSGPWDQLRGILDAYGRASAITRLGGHVLGHDSMEGSAGPERSTPAERQEATLGVYERSVARITALADEYDIAVTFFWQPIQPPWSAAMRAGLPDQTVDLSDLLVDTDPSVFIDQAHTNERGARRVAEGMWETLAPEFSATSPRALRR